MHPIERLRFVARADGAGPTALGIETALALLGFGDDPAGMVTACRRLVDRHPACGPVWWVTSRALLAPDPDAELRVVAGLLEEDPTPAHLGAELPGSATVAVVGWPEQVAMALDRRADCRVLVVDGGEGALLVRALRRNGGSADLIPDRGAGAAVASADLLLLEALAVAGESVVLAAGSLAAAAVAASTGVPVWLIAGEGRVLDPRLGDVLVGGAAGADEPWLSSWDVVPLAALVGATGVGPGGRVELSALVGRGDCPVAPELLPGRSPGGPR